jgi:hypothetical protein
MYWEDQNYSCIVDAAIELIRDERLYNLGNLGLVVCGDHYRIKIGHYEGVEVKGRKDKVPPEILAQAKRVSLAWPYL